MRAEQAREFHHPSRAGGVVICAGADGILRFRVERERRVPSEVIVVRPDDHEFPGQGAISPAQDRDDVLRVALQRNPVPGGARRAGDVMLEELPLSRVRWGAPTRLQAERAEPRSDVRRRRIESGRARGSSLPLGVGKDGDVAQDADGIGAGGLARGVAPKDGDGSGRDGGPPQQVG